MATRTIRIGPLLALVGCFGVTALALWVLTDDEEVVEVEVDERGRPLSQREVADRDRADFVAMARGERPDFEMMIRAFEGAGPDFYGSGEVGVDDARRVFNAVMDEVDTMAARPRRLRQRQWQEVYRTANDSFAALSMHLDAKDRDQAKELEDAHKRLQQGLASLRVRGNKFKLTRD
jgi:hypothetical protein